MFHPLVTDIEPPSELNNPFNYVPHALTLLAAGKLCDYLETQTQWAEEIAAGKMFGVLVCRDDDGRLGFLAAYSGQLGGRADWPWFVPAVLDYLQPDGHFKTEEARITAINRQVDALENADEYHSLTKELEQVKADGEREISRYRQYMQACKQRRDAVRAAGHCDEAALIAESQHQKAELRRMKKHWQEETERVGERLRPMSDRIDSLRHERRQRSDALQQWLFDHFILQNRRGERRSLTGIFADTGQTTPPSGAGECCAPKLLHHAFTHHLQPLCMGELWQGRSPQMEVRHHGQFYPACRGKCKPILEWMLGMADSDEGPIGSMGPMRPMNPVDPMEAMEPMNAIGPKGLKIVYKDESIIVVSKPSGLLSVPGKHDHPSVENILGGCFGRVFMPHRLDQDTSGLLVVARTMDAYHHMQQQFLERTVSKEYEALLLGTAPGDRPCGSENINDEGIVSLPLRPDLDDRPRQLVDREHGKAAVTHYRIISREEGLVRVLLIPHTGRTHQLRVHCAHHDGLGMPIAGDSLYGRADGAPRLCLHARMLAFRHPATSQPMAFTDITPF